MKSACSLLLLISISIAPIPAQETDKQHVKTAAEAFKNVQVLKRVPADQWFDTMAFIAGSLGVTCDHCHSSSFELDEGNKSKLQARQMMRMVDEINRDSFEGKVVVTCNTCHRGALKPQAAPVPDADHWKRPTDKPLPLPSTADVIARYRKSVGLGTNPSSLPQAVLFNQETYDGMGGARPASVEVQLDGSGRVRVTERANDKIKTLVRNGPDAWSNEGKGWRKMSAGEASTAFEAADLLDPDQAGDVSGSGAVFEDRARGHRTYVVPVESKGERKWLFFDAETGFLLRQRFFFSSFYADGSTDIDYAEYQKMGNLYLPATFYVVNAGGSGLTIRRATSRKTNVKLSDSQFRPDAG